MPAGRIPPNPAELLGSQRFRDFLASLGEHFDWVIDRHAAGHGGDRRVASSRTRVQGVVFVVGAEMTSRSRGAGGRSSSSRRPRRRFFGAVLNRVDLKRNAYYYSQYYRREYSTYYTKQAPSS